MARIITNRKILRIPLEKSEIPANELGKIKKRLYDALKNKKNGIGISANQCSIKRRVCLINVRDNAVYLINPEITKHSEEVFLLEESCLSFPKSIRKPVLVSRYMWVTLTTDNIGEITVGVQNKEDLNSKEKNDVIMECAAIQHEIDHLNGINIYDRNVRSPYIAPKKIQRNELVVLKNDNNDTVAIKYKRIGEYIKNGYKIA